MSGDPFKVGGGGMEIPGGKFLSFQLGREFYAVPIRQVKEIIGLTEIIHIPATPGHIKGVVNLRGKIIPVFDLRSKLGVKAQTRGERTCVFVFAINTADAQYLAGAAVDAIAEVVNINGGDIEPPPQDTWIEEDFLIGLGKLKGKVLMILALAPLLNEEEIVFIKKEFGEKRESLVFGLEKALETS